MEPGHIIAGLLTMAPLPNPSGSPLGKYGPLVATIIAVGIVAAAITIHVAAAIVPGSAVQSDPFIDSAALLVIGVVLGASALGGQAQAAHEAANAANKRLDTIGAPPARDGGTA